MNYEKWYEAEFAFRKGGFLFDKASHSSYVRVNGEDFYLREYGENDSPVIVLLMMLMETGVVQ